MSYPLAQVAARANSELEPCDAWNFNADLIDESLIDAQITTNGLLTLTKTNGEFIDNTIPFFTNFVTSGIELTLDTPPNGLDLIYTDGQYQVDAQLFDVTASTLIITAGDVTNPRRDLIIGDNLGVISILTGTPAASPTYPAQPANTLILGRLFVPANADATTGDILLTIETRNIVETGTDEDTLRYEASTLTWVPNSNLKSDGASIDIGQYGAYTERVNIDGRILLADTSAPGTTTNKLYSVSGDLYWDGSQLNTAASVGAGSITDSVLRWSGAGWVEESDFRIESDGETQWYGVGNIRVASMGNDGISELYSIGTGDYISENRVGLQWKQSAASLELIYESALVTSSLLNLSAGIALLRTVNDPDFTQIEQQYNQLVVTSHSDTLTENTFLINPAYFRLGGQLEAASNRYFFIDSTNTDGASEANFRIFGDNIGAASDAGNPSIQASVITDASYIDMGVAYGPKAGIHIKQTTASTPDISIGHNVSATIGAYAGIEIMRNVGSSKTSKAQDNLAITIGSKSSIVNDGIVNSVIIANTAMTASKSNTTYSAGGQVNKLYYHNSSADYTTLESDYFISFNTDAGGGGSRTVNLIATPETGRTYVIKDSGGKAAARNIILNPAGATLIDGAATKTINSNYGSFIVVYNGTSWDVY